MQLYDLRYIPKHLQTINELKIKNILEDLRFMGIKPLALINNRFEYLIRHVSYYHIYLLYIIKNALYTVNRTLFICHLYFPLFLV